VHIEKEDFRIRPFGRDGAAPIARKPPPRRAGRGPAGDRQRLPSDHPVYFQRLPQELRHLELGAANAVFAVNGPIPSGGQLYVEFTISRQWAVCQIRLQDGSGPRRAVGGRRSVGAGTFLKIRQRRIPGVVSFCDTPEE